MIGTYRNQQEETRSSCQILAGNIVVRDQLEDLKIILE